MATVIRASDNHRAMHAVAFNFDDLSSKADAYLAKVREQAASLLQEATRQADGIRKKAEAEGRQAGLAAIDQSVQQKVAQQMQSVLPALEQAAREISGSRNAWIAQWEKEVVKLSAAIAKKIVRGELTRQPHVTPKLVREALELALGSSQIRLCLHADDHGTILKQVQAVIHSLGCAGKVEVVTDAGVERGCCRVDTQFGSVDQQTQTALERIISELIDD